MSEINNEEYINKIVSSCLKLEVASKKHNDISIFRQEIELISKFIHSIAVKEIENIDYKLQAMQGLLDGQAVIIKEIEDELEQVKFALEVESHDNEYNKDKYKAIADELAVSLDCATKIIEKNHGLAHAKQAREAWINTFKEKLAKYEELKK